MAEATELTPSQKIRLTLLTTVGFDTAAAAKAIEYVADDPLKSSLFQQQYSRTYPDTSLVSKMDRVIQNCKEALTLFSSTPQAAAESSQVANSTSKTAASS